MTDELEKLRVENSLFRSALKELRTAIDQGECRADEDCDHCHLIYEIIDPVLAETPLPGSSSQTPPEGDL